MRDPLKLLGGQRDDREASLSHQRRVGEQLVGFDLCQGAWFRDGMAGLDPYLGNFRVADVDRFNGRRAYHALFVAGLLGGVGGGHLSIAYTKTWQEGMTAGAGFIAVGLVIFAAWSPIRAIGGAVLFGAAVALQLQLQARGSNVSPFLLDMIPYLLVLAVLMFFGRVKGRVVPAGLKDVFEGTG